MHKNILTVVGITFLFLGLAIQPSVATVQPEKIDVEPDVEGLVTQIRIVINEILQDYGHIPIVSILGNKIIDILELFGKILRCVFLIVIAIPLFSIIAIIGMMMKLGLIQNYSIGDDLFWLALGIALGLTFFCTDFKSPLKSISNINRLYTSDTPTLTGLDECPCMQE